LLLLLLLLNIRTVLRLPSPCTPLDAFLKRFVCRLHLKSPSNPSPENNIDLTVFVASVFANEIHHLFLASISQQLPTLLLENKTWQYNLLRLGNGLVCSLANVKPLILIIKMLLLEMLQRVDEMGRLIPILFVHQ
jgi:hypothetical protein